MKSAKTEKNLKVCWNCKRARTRVVTDIWDGQILFFITCDLYQDEKICDWLKKE